MSSRLLLPSLVLLLSACGSPATGAPEPSAPAAPASASVASASVAPSAPAAVCSPPATPTPVQTEGPYFTAGSPERANLVEDGMAGTRLALEGLVLDTACAPIAGAVVDIWQADSAGVYDTAGFRLRGHVATAADGSFRFATIIPGEYPGRTEHLHVKVTPPGGATLTSQLYFPGVPENRGDGIFSPALLVDLADAADGAGKVARFTFVLAP